MTPYLSPITCPSSERPDDALAASLLGHASTRASPRLDNGPRGGVDRASGRGVGALRADELGPTPGEPLGDGGADLGGGGADLGGGGADLGGGGADLGGGGADLGGGGADLGGGGADLGDGGAPRDGCGAAGRGTGCSGAATTRRPPREDEGASRDAMTRPVDGHTIAATSWWLPQWMHRTELKYVHFAILHPGAARNCTAHQVRA
ncbi:hypothetical protein WME98_18320 [Sorangium sp. So ce296]|uniref:hypothetical protein n=1 Tax=Sorangium sp. So ce296 TaxID=3133296 RepID=UPI003F5F3B33